LGSSSWVRRGVHFSNVCATAAAALHIHAPLTPLYTLSTAGFTGFFVKLIHIPINSILMT